MQVNFDQVFSLANVIAEYYIMDEQMNASITHR